VLLDKKRFGESSRALLRRLAQAKIQARPLWQPAHLSRAHKGAQAYYCEVAERLNREALSLPCSVNLSAAQQQKVIAAVLNRS
jgi:perosamine synthetase